VLTSKGVIKEKVKFATPKSYDNFLLELRHAVAKLETQDFKAAGFGVPGRLNRKHGRVIRLGNLSWKNVPLQDNAQRILKCPVILENDANLGGLSEAQLHPDTEAVLYVTISTGIGTGFVHNRQLDPGLLDMEGGNILLEHKGKLVRWESFASGKAIYKHFGKKVADIPASDKTAWAYIVRNLMAGLQANIAITQPDLIIIGGGVGTYYDRYAKLLKAELEKNALPVVKTPRVVQAKRPEEAVIYGCYDLAKQVYGHADSDN
jgi:predicted NBD/HSP70 family sugar kinase